MDPPTYLGGGPFRSPEFDFARALREAVAEGTTLTLEQYYRLTAAVGFGYGSNDCLLWVASWAMLRGHPDPAEPYRGRYRTATSARRFVREHGGLVAVAAAGAARAGLKAIDPREAVSGDVGVGTFDATTGWGRRAPVGLIRAGLGWAAISASGAVVIGDAEPELAWRI